MAADPTKDLRCGIKSQPPRCTSEEEKETKMMRNRGKEQLAGQMGQPAPGGRNSGFPAGSVFGFPRNSGEDGEVFNSPREGG